MSNGVKISNLDSASALDGTESLPVVQSSTTVKATVEQIKTLVQAAMPAANITGTLGVAHGGTGAVTLTGLVKGSGTAAFAAATAGTDFVAPGGALGTPSSGVLTNATGLPVSTGISGLGTSVATFLATPTSANLATAVTNETGSGSLVFATSPTLVTPALGTPASGVATNLTGLPISTGISGLGTGVATFLATPSSANLSAAITDETGSGALVFATSPTFVTPALGTPSSVTLTNGTGLPIGTGVSGLGTGIATALAISTGSAGAPLLFNGAGGTPSSLTGTNITGLPLSTGVTGTLPITNGGTGQTTAGAAFNALSPVTTTGDLIVGNGANSATRLAIGASSYVLTSNGTTAAWATVPGASLTVGTSSISSGTTTRVLYDNAGVLGEYTITGTAGSVVMSASPTFTGNINFPNSTVIGGTVGVAGLLNDGSNTAIRTYAAGAIFLQSAGGAATFGDFSASRFSLAVPLLYGGVTLSNSVTGTGSMVLSASPSITLPTLVASGGVVATTNRANTSTDNFYRFQTAAASEWLLGQIYGGTANNSFHINYQGASPAGPTLLGTDIVSIGSNGFVQFSGGLTTGGALTYGGVTLANSVTGTGSMVLSASPTFTGTVTAPAFNATSNYQFNGATLALVTSGYTVLYGGAGAQNIFLGSNDPTNYYRNTTHNFQTIAGAATIVSMNSTVFTFSVPMNYGGVTLSNSVTGTGSMVLSASPTISGTTTFGSATLAQPSGSAPLAMARAWVNFNGGSGAINGSLNVSSVTRNSGGQYTVNLTTAAPNTTYAKVASGNGGAGVFTGSDWSAATVNYFTVYAANTLSQAYQDGNPVNAVAYW